MTSTGFYGWKLVAALWVILFMNLAFPMYGSSVINSYMVTDLGLDRRTLGLMFSVYMLMSGLPGPLVAIFVNRMGVRLTLVLGSLFLVAGALTMAFFVSTGTQAVLVFGIIIGLGVVTGGPLAAQTGVAFWFIRRRALAISIILSAGGIGGFVAARVLNRMIAAADGNWRVGWWLVAGLACVAAVVAALFVKDKPGDIGQQTDGGPPAGDAAKVSGARPKARAAVYITQEEWTFADAAGTPALWLLMLCAVGFSAGLTQIMAHGIIHLQDLGHTPDAAARSFSILVVSTLIGKLVLGVFGDRIEPRYLWSGATAIFGVGMIIVVNATSTLDLYVYAVCLGAGFGGGLVCMMTVLSNFYGSKAYASVVGITLAIQTTAGAIGSYVAGDFYDRFGSYALAFNGAGVLCLAGAVLLLFIRPPTRTTVRAGSLSPSLQ